MSFAIVRVGMFGRSVFRILAVLTLAMTAPVFADTYDLSIDVRAESLSAALMDLARQTGVELLFDHAIVGGIQCPRLRGKLTVEAALRRLLDGTDLTTRRSTTGAWIIERRTARLAGVAE